MQDKIHRHGMAVTWKRKRGELDDRRCRVFGAAILIEPCYTPAPLTDEIDKECKPKKTGKVAAKARKIAVEVAICMPQESLEAEGRNDTGDARPSRH